MYHSDFMGRITDVGKTSLFGPDNYREGTGGP
jgi:hypothetical protein